MGKKNGLSRYLFRKGDTFYVRMAIPKPLRTFFGGKDILIRSLGTRDPKVAENRKDIEVGQIKAEFERLANQDPLAPQAVGSLVRWETEAAGATLAAIGGGEALTLGALSVEAMTTDDPQRKAELEARKRAMLESARGGALDWQRDLAARRGRFALTPQAVVDPSQARQWIREANTLLDFQEGGGDADEAMPLAEVAAMVSGADLGEIARAQIAEEIPAALLPARARPYLARPRPRGVPSDDNITLGDLIERFFADSHRANLAVVTRRNYETTVRILKEVLGENVAVRSIGRDDIRRVQDVILNLPAPDAKRDGRFDGMDFRRMAQTVKTARAKGEIVPCLMSGTRNKYLRNISTIFTYALNEQKIDAHPALGLTLHLPDDRQEEGKEPFGPDDLRAMFPRAYRVEGLNWLPLVMLYHGLRPSEAAQLDVADVMETDGVWAIDISDQTRGADGAARWGDKSLKNDRSTPRRIPIHQRMLDLGFLDYLKARQQAGERKLFAVKRYGQAGYFASIRDDFAAWLAAVGVKRSTTSPHSLRHTWNTTAFPVMDDRIRKIIGGWTLGKGVDVRTYLHTNRLSLADMKRELDKVAFEVLSAEVDSARAHPGLIGMQRRFRPGEIALKSPKKKRLVPGKVRGADKA
jgi:integrase